MVCTLPTTPAAVITARPFSIPFSEPLLIVTVLDAGDTVLPIICTTTADGGYSFLKFSTALRRSFSARSSLVSWFSTRRLFNVSVRRIFSLWVPRRKTYRVQTDPTALKAPPIVRSKKPDTARTGFSRNRKRPLFTWAVISQRGQRR